MIILLRELQFPNNMWATPNEADTSAHKNITSSKLYPAIRGILAYTTFQKKMKDALFNTIPNTCTRKLVLYSMTADRLYWK
jgi:hypothetical protein